MKQFKSAAILAGGKSTRMGFDKQLLEINGRRIIETMIETLKKEFEDIIVVSYKPELYENLKVRVVSDIIKDNGLLGGIHTAISYSESSFVYVVACDMPHLNLSYIDFMKEKLIGTENSSCITRNGEWIEPLNAFYSRELTEDIELFLSTGKRSVYPFLKNHKTLYIEESDARKFSPEFKMFLNLNTEEELSQYNLSKSKD